MAIFSKVGAYGQIWSSNDAACWYCGNWSWQSYRLLEQKNTKWTEPPSVQKYWRNSGEDQNIRVCFHYVDCTPDQRHNQQLSFIVRIVLLGYITQIIEHFMGFLVAEESTGEGLSSLIFKRLEELNIPFEDCRGQSYDNGTNMKEKNKGVQGKLLQQNSRAFFVACGARFKSGGSWCYYDLKDAIGYFWYLIKLFKPPQIPTETCQNYPEIMVRDQVEKQSKKTFRSWSARLGESERLFWRWGK